MICKEIRILVQHTDLIEMMEASMKSFSKSHRKIARFFIDNYAKAAYMTASELGAAVGVSESTVVRFATEMGCNGYPEFQAQARENVKMRLTSVQRVDEANGRMEGRDVLEMILTADMERIKSTLATIDRKEFVTAINMMMEAENIYILGMRASAMLAEYMRYYFGFLFDNVKVIQPTGGSEIFESLLKIHEGDVFVGISFPRYTKRIVNATEYASKAGAKVIALTDSKYSPIVPHSDVALLAKSEMASFADSLVAPMSLINAMIAYIGKIKHEQVTETLGKLEQVWREYDVYTSFSDER
ncbi:MAG: MurR/RpiR family transcriptional regulator [Clostridia bacterium]|nr:MurR/RpiR family transcriptional regulator [Clostridia bacterium]